MSSLLSLVLLVFLVFRRISVFQFKSESFFSLKPSAPQGEIIPQNFSSLGFAVSEELGNKQTDNSLISYCFFKVISFIKTRYVICDMFAVSEELGNKQTDNSLISYCFFKVISFIKTRYAIC